MKSLCSVISRRVASAYVVLGALMLVPAGCFGAAITVNGTCEVGNCVTPSSLGVGTKATGSFDVNYTLGNGDVYNISGTYSNSYAPQHLGFFPTVIYIGNGGNPLAASVGGDTISLDMIQNFFDPTPGVWNGNYCESFDFNVAAGGTATGNIYFDGNPIGLLVGNAGTSNPSMCRDITFSVAQNLNNYMATQMLINYSFAPGSQPGAMISSPNADPVSSAPEPAAILSGGLSCLVGLCFVRRRKTPAALSNEREA